MPYLPYLSIKNLNQCHTGNDIQNAVEMLKLWNAKAMNYPATFGAYKKGKNLSAWSMCIHTAVYIVIISQTQKCTYNKEQLQSLCTCISTIDIVSMKV